MADRATRESTARKPSAPLDEYFHGDNGAGLGASHQTGWTGTVAKLIELFGVLDAQKALELGKVAFAPGTSEAKTTAHELTGS